MSQAKLKALLKERDITGAQLSRECGITQSTVYNIIAGRQYVWPKWRRKISEYLEVPQEELFDLSENYPTTEEEAEP